jgi:hypothetical protein
MRDRRRLVGVAAVAALLVSGCGQRVADPGASATISAPTSSATSSPPAVHSAASDARNSASSVDLRRVTVDVTASEVTVGLGFYAPVSFDCGSVAVQLGPRNLVVLARRKGALQATAYQGVAPGHRTVTGHPAVTRAGNLELNLGVRRSLVPAFDAHGWWVAPSLDSGCGLAGTYDRVPDRGRVLPRH